MSLEVGINDLKSHLAVRTVVQYDVGCFLTLPLHFKCQNKKKKIASQYFLYGKTLGEVQVALVGYNYFSFWY